MERRVIAAVGMLAILACIAGITLCTGQGSPPPAIPATGPSPPVSPGPGPGFALPAPRTDSPVSVEEALLSRRSVRSYRNEPLTIPEVGQLLWAAQGITGAGGLRATPSAGALYPLEILVVAGDVTGLAPGIYRYRPADHTLARIREGDTRKDLARAALGQAPVEEAPAVIVIAGVSRRTTGKYGERGVRYVHMEAGHCSQNLYLQAVPLDLGTVAIGAFDDRQVAAVLGLDPGEEPLYLMPVGKV